MEDDPGEPGQDTDQLGVERPARRHYRRLAGQDRAPSEGGREPNLQNVYCLPVSPWWITYPGEREGHLALLPVDITPFWATRNRG